MLPGAHESFNPQIKFLKTSFFNPLTPRPYNSYNVGSDNLVLDQLIIPKLIFYFILITYLVDIVLTLLGEILSWSLMAVKELSNGLLMLV